MSSVTITTWMNQEKTSFTNFNEFIAVRTQDGALRSIAEYLRRALKSKSSASVTVPWGTFSAEVKTVGEGTNVGISYEPSKNFLHLLNDDPGNLDRRQDTFDPDYVKLFRDYVAYGFFDPDQVKNAPAREKGMRMSEDEVEYFLNSYMQMLVSIARDKQRAGKSYELVIDEGYDFGTFKFEYSEDKIEVRFTPSKVFKQTLKNDDAAEMAIANELASMHAAASIIGGPRFGHGKATRSSKKSLRDQRDADGFVVLGRLV